MTEYALTQGHSSVALTPPFTQKYGNYEGDFVQAMRSVGIDFRDKIIADGALHRFSTDKKGQKDGWYVFYGMAGAFGDWRQDIHEKWSPELNGLLHQDQNTLRQQRKEAFRTAEEEKYQRYEETSHKAFEQWTSLSEEGESPYLLKKKVEPFGIRFNKDTLVIPLRDASGKLYSLQYIYPDGTKRFLTGGRKKSCFHHIGVLEDGNPILVCEGYATGASLYMATHQPTVISFDAGNLEPVVEELKKAYPNSPIKIYGDDDVWKDTNTGRTIAEQVTLKHNCSVVFPRFKNTETKPTDFNDLHVLEGLTTVKEQIEKALQHKVLNALNIKDLLSLEVPPRNMILRPVIPEQGLVMIHAPPRNW